MPVCDYLGGRGRVSHSVALVMPQCVVNYVEIIIYDLPTLHELGQFIIVKCRFCVSLGRNTVPESVVVINCTHPHFVPALELYPCILAHSEILLAVSSGSIQGNMVL